jgi:hypothetical protein
MFTVNGFQDTTVSRCKVLSLGALSELTKVLVISFTLQSRSILIVMI